MSGILVEEYIPRNLVITDDSLLATTISAPRKNMTPEATARRKEMLAFQLGRHVQQLRGGIVGARKQRRMNNSRLVGAGSPFSQLPPDPQDYIPGPTHNILPPDFYSVLNYVDDSFSPNFQFGDNLVPSSPEGIHRTRKQVHQYKQQSAHQRDLSSCISRLQKALKHAAPSTRELVAELDQRIRFFAIEAVLLEGSNPDSSEQSPDAQSIPPLEEDSAEDGSGDDWDDANTVIVNPAQPDSAIFPSALRALRRLNIFSRESGTTTPTPTAEIRETAIVTAQGDRESITSDPTIPEEDHIVLVSYPTNIPDFAAVVTDDDFDADTDTEQADAPIMSGIELSSDGNPQMCIHAADEQDNWARFTRFLVHTIADYYGLETWSLTVQQPSGPPVLTSNVTTIHSDRPQIVMSRWRRAYVGVEPTSEIMGTIPTRRRHVVEKAEGEEGESETVLEEISLDDILASLPLPLSQVL